MKKLVLVLILAVSSIVASAQWWAQEDSKVSINAHLDGRGTEGSLPRPSNSVHESGRIFIMIWVDNYGKVVRAQINKTGTDITDTQTLNAARTAALNTRFKQDMDAPSIQQGMISYVFNYTTEDVVGSARPGVIKFLDIPVDGNRNTLETALKAKGFSREYRTSEVLEGVFNGETVELIISTNHDVVDRIQIKYPYLQEEEIRIKFNNLISRYGRTGKYVTLRNNQPISETEPFAKNLAFNKKRYDAIFYFLEPDVDAVTWKASFMKEYNKRYSKDLQTLSQEEVEEIMFCLPEEIVNSISGVVWFYLRNSNHLEVFYDNMKNRPHGEDL